MNRPPLRFPEFEGDWEKKKLGEVIDKLESGVSVNSTDESVKNKSEFGILKTSAVYLGRFFAYENKKIIEAEVERARLNPVKNSILISRMNTPQLVGNSGLVENDYPNLFIPDRLWLAKANSDTNPKMLSIVLSTEKTMNMISNIATGTSGSMKNISQPNFLNLVISLPTLPEQTKIASFLTAVDEKLQALKKKKSLLENYKKGIMQKLFSKELRFKDENGEEFADWEVKKLGEVGEIVTGKTPSTADLDLWNGEIQFVTPTDIDENKYQYETQRTIKKLSKTKLLPSKSIMFTCIASIGKMSLSIKPCVTNQQINSIIPFKEFDNEFIFYAMLNIVDYIKSTQSTNTLPIINKTEFSKFEINIPTDEKEQTAIAQFLSALDEKINHIQNQITQTEQYKKGLFQKMFV